VVGVLTSGTSTGAAPAVSAAGTAAARLPAMAFLLRFAHLCIRHQGSQPECYLKQVARSQQRRGIGVLFIVLNFVLSHTAMGSWHPSYLARGGGLTASLAGFPTCKNQVNSDGDFQVLKTQAICVRSLRVALAVGSIARCLDVLITLTDPVKLGSICWIIFCWSTLHSALSGIDDPACEQEWPRPAAVHCTVHRMNCIVRLLIHRG